VLAKNPEAVAKIKEGNKKPVDFLIGQVMKKLEARPTRPPLPTLIQKNCAHKKSPARPFEIRFPLPWWEEIYPP